MRYKPFSRIIIRTPLLPFETIDNVKDINSLALLYNNEIIQEAIYLASPELHDQILSSLNNIDNSFNKREKLYYTLNKYVSRMSTRCTPFGLFANCMVGLIGDKNVFNVCRKIDRHVRFDMYYLCNLVQTLLKDSDLRKKINYYPNNTIYKIGQEYRYVEYQNFINNRCHKLSSVKADLYLKEILKNAKNGNSIEHLANSLLEIEEDLSIDNIIEFIESIIENKILISELEPTVVGEDYLSHILYLMNLRQVNGDICNRLTNVELLLMMANKQDKEHITLYKRIKAEIKDLNEEVNEKYLLQVDSNRAFQKNILNKEILDEVVSSATFLFKVFANTKNQDLTSFKKKFKERYDYEEVPLLIALDPEIGLGYPIDSFFTDSSTLINDIKLPRRGIANSNYINSPLEDVLLNKLLNNSSDEIELCDEDMSNIFEKNDGSFPPTISILFEIINTDKGEIINLRGVVNSGANLFARFAYSNTEILKLLKEIGEKEKALFPNQIIAEIAHLPNSRVGNILMRPSFRDAIIPCVSDSYLYGKEKILLSDLSISIRDEKVFLYHTKWKKEIIPRLTTAHNYHKQTIPIYRFLCDLQCQEYPQSITFSWGRLSEIQNRLPRIRYKNTILSPATWRVHIKDLENIIKSPYKENLIEKVTAWRNKMCIPQFFLLVEGDNRLYIDSLNLLSVQTFLYSIRHQKQFLLEEFLPDKKALLIEDENKSTYLSEFIVAFYKETT